jgi:hypothetical protein
MNDFDFFLENYQYKADGKIDSYRILPMGDLNGDCDDFVTTALYLTCNKSLWLFWFKLITFQAQMWRVYTSDGGRHLILYVNGLGYIDNGSIKWVTRQFFEDWGYVFRYPNPFPIVALKMLIGKIAK